ncbi:metallophosphoesterase family protein [Pokkaliibacter sp. MBI-7]|uniref:metallophosphoesterase family protein n=1 Tax=Pokkaliibacter sp. MBI-7 TaxID=3040600 RepID=UPI00244D3D45|nr:metallophosphoesterase family protein [Pokkaliibacter sp. MBI-7]MDH2431374.1 metallophosphoesterase family protein [Pokkaliibacter sp. MBI-7]
MKIAALSDIHSNVFALEAVINDAQRRGARQLLNLGDILYGAIAPRATYDVLKKHSFITIRGNQDRQIYESGPADIAANPTLAFILQDLEQEPLDWMQGLPFDAWLFEGDASREIYLCHGSPSNDLIYLLENVESGSARVRGDDEIISLLDGHRSPLILCGHTHTPRVVKLSTGQLIVNPGSVGLPAYMDDEPVPHSMETFSPHASYALLEWHEAGWQVELVRVPYDHELAARIAANRGRHDWAHYLRTGRGLHSTS